MFGDAVDVEKHNLRQKRKLRDIANKKMSSAAMDKSPRNGKGRRKSRVDSLIQKSRQSINYGKVETKNSTGTGLSISLTKDLDSKKIRKSRALNLERTLIFEDLNVKVKAKEKVCVTSYSEEIMTNFLLTLRGETFITEGSIELNGVVVYLDGNR